MTDNKIIKIEDSFYITSQNLEKAQELIADYIKKNGSIKVGDAGKILDSSRKHMIPFLEYLDLIHFTKREENERVLY